jgi:N-acetylglucosamine-6-phosphate deacetylase
MATCVPAKLLGVFDCKGSIAANKDADVVVLDENYRIVITICRGEICYQRIS